MHLSVCGDSFTILGFHRFLVEFIKGWQENQEIQEMKNQ